MFKCLFFCGESKANSEVAPSPQAQPITEKNHPELIHSLSELKDQITTYRENFSTDADTNSSSLKKEYKQRVNALIQQQNAIALNLAGIQLLLEQENLIQLSYLLNKPREILRNSLYDLNKLKAGLKFDSESELTAEEIKNSLAHVKTFYVEELFSQFNQFLENNHIQLNSSSPTSQSSTSQDLAHRR